MRATATLVIGIAVLVAALASSPGHAQESQSILPSLLTEVRGLRAAMEHMASAGPRVQLALGRLQLQEQRVNTLMRRLETIRDNLASAQTQLGHHQGQMAQMEAALKGNPSEEREQVEHMMVMFKGQITAANNEVQRLMGEESSVAADIASEQARWTDFNQRLEELERTLARK